MDTVDLGVWPHECPIKFEELSCEEIAHRHQDCSDPDCLICQFHEALMCDDRSELDER